MILKSLGFRLEWLTGSWVARWLTRPAAALLMVSVLTAVLVALDADFAVASLLLVVVVVLASLLGYAAGFTAAFASYLSLNSFFTVPDDAAVALVAYTATVVAVGATVARMDTLRRQATVREQEARDARLLAAVEEERAGFLSAMTHNLRTPLGAIKAAVSALGAPDVQLSAAEEEELLEVAFDETDRLERLVTKVLELSRIRAGFLDVDYETVDVGDLIREAVRRLRHLATDHEIRLVVDGTVPLVPVDPAMIALVMVSLLENALRFAPPGSGVVVRVTRAAAGVEIRIVDHGPGIAACDRVRVFEAFERGDAPTDGTGLGLAIARAFVNAHHGSIAVDDTPGGGATFVVSLPGEVPT
jgi:K+-sensing histidine kinase KdpD